MTRPNEKYQHRVTVEYSELHSCWVATYQYRSSSKGAHWRDYDSASADTAMLAIVAIGETVKADLATRDRMLAQLVSKSD